MNESTSSYTQALRKAQDDLRKGDITSARRWAQQAASLEPEHEEPWLILAAVASPRASLSYLNRALAINPQSQRARKGMHWAIRRLRAEEEEGDRPTAIAKLPANPVSSEKIVKRQKLFAPWMAGLLLLAIGLVGWLSFPAFSRAFESLPPLPVPQTLADASLTPTASATITDLPTNTQTPTDTPTLTYTPTATDTPTFTPTPSPSNTPTSLPTATETATLPPTDTIPPSPTDTEEPEPVEPTLGPDGKRSLPELEPGERWIDVDLSQQRVYAYEGDQLIESFRVSTGRPQTPTVQGQYRIYVKLRSANMSGPDYFLADVPFIMYFYKGYGLHGTYWHNNFGTPMSHGCVNLKTKEAKWLFEFASVGTIVNVHR